MSVGVDKAVEVYRSVAQCPSVVGAELLPIGDSQYLLESHWNQHDLERGDNVAYTKWASFAVENSRLEVGTKSPSSETNGVLISRYSNSGKLKAVIREVTDKDGKKIQYFEIWDEWKKITNVNLKELDKHGQVHVGNPFGCLEWSKDGSKIVYVAEAKTPKTESFFKIKEKEVCRHPDKGKADQAELKVSEKEECQREESQPGNQHVYKESWGEQLVECHCPTVCTFDLNSNEVVSHSDLIPPGVSAGQAMWCHDGNSIVFVRWKHEPFRLGLRYCPTRKSALYLLHPKSGTCKKLTGGDQAVFSPRMHPVHDRVVYFENVAEGPHQNCAKVFTLDLPSSHLGEVPTPRLVVDAVSHADDPDEFPGLFIFDPQARCWSQDGDFVFLSSSWRATVSVLAINITDGVVQRLTSEGEATVLDVKDDILVISHSTPSFPPQIMAGKFISGDIEWKTIEQPSAEFTTIKWSVHPYKPELPNLQYPEVDCDYILIQPIGEEQGKSLIVNPHGGPHDHSRAGFDPEIAGYCLLGYAVIQVNYRGSQGYGKDGIYSLPGLVGTQDVRDVHQVAVKVKEDFGIEQICAVGISHGGFLALHMISQYPDFYSAGVAKNPVTNLASMVDTTDIPEWAHCEAGLDYYKDDILPSAEAYAAMLARSPIIHIAKAKAPCLMILGDADLRCPPSQGKGWAKKYKALGKTCRVLEYEGSNHPLVEVNVAADSFVNMVLWFEDNK